MRSNLPKTVWFRGEAFVLALIGLVAAIVSAAAATTGILLSLLIG